MTVGELLGRVSSREISEWRAYLRLEDEDRERRKMQREAGEGATERAHNPRRRT